LRLLYVPPDLTFKNST